MAHQNTELGRKGYQAFADGDMETLAELIADDVVWHVPGDNAISGDYKGRDEVFAFFAKIMELTGGNFRADTHDVLGNDDHIVALIAENGQRPDGRKRDGDAIHVMHVTNGQVSEFWAHNADQTDADAFWS